MTLKVGDKVTPIEGEKSGKIGTVVETSHNGKSGVVQFTKKEKPEFYRADQLLVQAKLDAR